MDAKQLPSRPSLEQYKKQAKDLVKACKSGDSEAIHRIKRHHNRLGKLSDSEIRSAKLALADAQFVMAREHGFQSWPKLAKHIEALVLTTSGVPQFESAVDAIVTGDVIALDSLLRETPELVRARSTREHQANLLHYAAANGVEDYRQTTPKNAVAVAETLLKAGADVDAPAEMYGGACTTMTLLVSSVHPAEAGLQVALVETLLDAGAAINGVADDSAPLMTALAFGYPDAAEALTRRGARVDNIVAAAGLGRLELVKSFVDEEGSQRADLPLVPVPGVHLPKDPKAYVEQALIWACMLGRTEVVAFLLQKGVDTARRGNQGMTALHCAAFYGHSSVIELLLERKAPLEIKNAYGGTVLDQTVWASLHRRVEGLHRNRVDYVPIIERLIAAGAKVDAVGPFPSGNTPVDELLQRHRAKASPRLPGLKS